MDFTKISSKALEGVIRTSPSILTGLAVAASATAIFFSIDATKRAVNAIIEEENIRRIETPKGEENRAVLSKKEVAELTWKFYIPTGVMFLLSASCIIGSNSINIRRQSALVSLYSLTDTALKEYQEKVIANIGEKKEKDIQESLIQDKLLKDPVESKEIHITPFGEVLCYDSLSGRYFNGSYEHIRSVQNDFNQKLLSEMWLSLNDLYYELGLEPTELGRDLGWSPEFGLLDVEYTSKIATDGRPCLVLNYKIKPRTE